MVKWSASLLGAPRVCGSNPAQGIFVGSTVCPKNYLCVLKKKEKKIHPNGMEPFKKVRFKRVLVPGLSGLAAIVQKLKSF